MSEELAALILPEFIGIFVPLEIMNLEECGGPTSEQFAEAKAYWFEVLDKGEGTELYFRIKGKTAKTAGMLVRLIACMAFEVGGVEIFGHRFIAYEQVTP